MKRTLIFIGIITLVLGTLSYGGWRWLNTAEGITYFGDHKAKVELCRSLPTLGEGRQKRLYKLLLADDSVDVRCSAVTAIGESNLVQAFSLRLTDHLEDPTESWEVKNNVVLVLQQHVPKNPKLNAFFRKFQDDHTVRARLSEPLATWYAQQLPWLDNKARASLVISALDETDPLHRPLSTVIQAKLSQFNHCRTEFLNGLKHGKSASTKRLAIAGLTAIDGVMRGNTVEAWTNPTPIPEVKPQAKGAYSPIEAEWAIDIRPNYMIQTFKGARCLALGEGAGGYMHWLKKQNGTVDIGKAQLYVHIPSDGHYMPWARLYFDDKCGNSFGFTLHHRKFGGKGAFNDKKVRLDTWHWVPLPLHHNRKDHYYFKAGYHPVELTAWEDAVYIDQVAMIPLAQKPIEGQSTTWTGQDSPISDISFSPQYQSQPRGSTQDIQVWVRRNDPDIKTGKLTLQVPTGFELTGPATRRITFAEHSPLQAITYTLHLPTDARLGENWLKATFMDSSGKMVRGKMVLGAQWDWQASGPISMGAPPISPLANAGPIPPSLKWNPLPLAGYDPYRRIDFEKAYGHLKGVYNYLTCEMEVTESGTYLGLLTADDTAVVYVNGREVISQPEGGPGEGRLVQQSIHLTKGTHRLFVKHFQADKKDPTGPHAGRASANHCNVKFLLRKSRYEPSEHIITLPSKH